MKISLVVFVFGGGGLKVVADAVRRRRLAAEVGTVCRQLARRRRGWPGVNESFTLPKQPTHAPVPGRASARERGHGAVGPRLERPPAAGERRGARAGFGAEICRSHTAPWC